MRAPSDDGVTHRFRNGGFGNDHVERRLKAQGAAASGHHNEPWTRVPDDYRNDIAWRGYHDGIEGARRDFDNHRQRTWRTATNIRIPTHQRAA